MGESFYWRCSLHNENCSDIRASINCVWNERKKLETSVCLFLVQQFKLKSLSLNPRNLLCTNPSAHPTLVSACTSEGLSNLSCGWVFTQGASNHRLIPHCSPVLVIAAVSIIKTKFSLSRIFLFGFHLLFTWSKSSSDLPPLWLIFRSGSEFWRLRWSKSVKYLHSAGRETKREETDLNQIKNLIQFINVREEY